MPQWRHAHRCGPLNESINKLLMDRFSPFCRLLLASYKTSPPTSPLHIFTPSHQSPSPLSLHPSVPLSSFIFNPQACLMRDADGHVIQTQRTKEGEARAADRQSETVSDVSEENKQTLGVLFRRQRGEEGWVRGFGGSGRLGKRDESSFHFTQKQVARPNKAVTCCTLLKYLPTEFTSTCSGVNHVKIQSHYIIPVSSLSFSTPSIFLKAQHTHLFVWAERRGVTYQSYVTQQSAWDFSWRHWMRINPGWRTATVRLMCLCMRLRLHNMHMCKVK